MADMPPQHPPAGEAIQSLGAGLWTLSFPMRFYGMELGRRVTLMETAPGELLVHSTAPFSPGQRSAIQRLGTVTGLVEATTLHDTFSQEGRGAFPGVPYFVPDRFPKAARGPEVRSLDTLGDFTGGTVRVQKLAGMRWIEEYACLHAASRTLVVGDLLFHLPQARGWTRWSLRHLAGIRDWPAIDRPFRLAIRNRAAFEASLEAILKWDFERLIVAHGEIMETDAKQHLREAAQRAGLLKT